MNSAADSSSCPGGRLSSTESEERDTAENAGADLTPDTLPRTDWARALLAWYARCKRNLPWRDVNDPYRVWVSEILLQQTRVDAVVAHYERFTSRFPTVESLARASLEEVLRTWEGFGYYARARNLHAAARIVVEKLGGRVPTDPETLRTLPGVGPYTAAAVASIAGNLPEPAVDANVERVGARFFAIEGVRGSNRLRKQVASALRAVMVCGELSPGDLNQALMDLGAGICTSGSPGCSRCPLAPWCEASARGNPGDFPRPAPRRSIPTYRIAVGVIRRKDGKILVARRPARAMLGGLWEFPGGKCRPGETEIAAVVREIREETGLEVTPGPVIATIRHAYSHFRIVLTAFWCRAPDDAKPECRAADELRWVALDELERLPFPRANRRLIAALHQAMR